MGSDGKTYTFADARGPKGASIAITIAQTAIETCKANGYAVSATVVGRNGEIIVQVRGDNTPPHTVENNFRKAYTARTLRSASGALVDRLKADPTLAFIHLTNIIAFQGALPIKVDDEVIGAAGVSGPRRRERRSLRQSRARQGFRSVEVTPRTSAYRLTFHWSVSRSQECQHGRKVA